MVRKEVITLVRTTGTSMRQKQLNRVRFQERLASEAALYPVKVEELEMLLLPEEEQLAAVQGREVQGRATDWDALLGISCLSCV